MKPGAAWPAPVKNELDQHVRERTRMLEEMNHALVAEISSMRQALKKDEDNYSDPPPLPLPRKTGEGKPEI